jgi:ComF family protein
MSILEKIISIIAPHECLSCQKEGLLLCAACQGALPPALLPNRGRTVLDTVIAATTYDGRAKDLVQALKFGRKKAASKVLAAVLARQVVNRDYTHLVHLPTASRRIRMRGYDQAELMARELAALLDIPCVPLLVRTGQQRQLGQGRAVRMQQMRQAFRIADESKMRGARILLIDDVLTTGASLEGAAVALKKAGAVRVDAAVFAVAASR